MTRHADDAALAAALAVLAAVIAARRCTPQQLGAVVAAMRDNGMAALAEILIGRVPFDGECNGH